MGGGDSRVWTPPRVARGQGNPAHCCLLGSRLGAQARAEDARGSLPRLGSWKKVVVFIQRGGGQRVECSRQGQLCSRLWGGQAGRDAPHPHRLHPAAPSSMPSPQLHLSSKRSNFSRAPFPWSAPLSLRWHLGRKEVHSPFLRSPKVPRPLGP